MIYPKTANLIKIELKGWFGMEADWPGCGAKLIKAFKETGLSLPSKPTDVASLTLNPTTVPAEGILVFNFSTETVGLIHLVAESMTH